MYSLWTIANINRVTLIHSPILPMDIDHSHDTLGYESWKYYLIW